MTKTIDRGRTTDEFSNEVPELNVTRTYTYSQNARIHAYVYIYIYI